MSLLNNKFMIASIQYDTALNYNLTKENQFRVKLNQGEIYRKLEEYVNSSEKLLEVVESASSNIESERTYKTLALFQLIENYYQNANYTNVDKLMDEVRHLMRDVESEEFALTFEILMNTYEGLQFVHDGQLSFAKQKLDEINQLQVRREALDCKFTNNALIVEFEKIILLRLEALYLMSVNETEQAMTLFLSLSDLAEEIGDQYHYELANSILIEYYVQSGNEVALVSLINELYEKEKLMKLKLQAEYQSVLSDYLPEVKREFIGTSIFFVTIGFVVLVMGGILIYYRKVNVVKRKLYKDPLCQVYNRRFLETKYKSLRAKDLPVSIMMIDIDYFKKYNDLYGHQAGDTALYKVATSLRTKVEKSGSVIRYGGEEFCIILPNMTQAQSSQLAKELLTEVANLQIIHEDSLIEPYITVSIGIQTLMLPQRIEKGINEADMALYEAKETGRNKFKHYLDSNKL